MCGLTELEQGPGRLEQSMNVSIRSLKTLRDIFPAREYGETRFAFLAKKPPGRWQSRKWKKATKMPASLWCTTASFEIGSGILELHILAYLCRLDLVEVGLR